MQNRAEIDKMWIEFIKNQDFLYHYKHFTQHLSQINGKVTMLLCFGVSHTAKMFCERDRCSAMTGAHHFNKLLEVKPHRIEVVEDIMVVNTDSDIRMKKAAYGGCPAGDPLDKK